MNITYVYCTSCGKKIPVMLMKYLPPSEDFPQGSYEGVCRACGAVSEYDADYIKSLKKD